MLSDISIISSITVIIIISIIFSITLMRTVEEDDVRVAHVSENPQLVHGRLIEHGLQFPAYRHHHNHHHHRRRRRHHQE